MPRFKFSITSILLVMALVAIAVSTLLHRRHVAELEREQQRVIQQTGYIVVDDPTKVYVRQLFCPAPETWQFQVYTPEGHELMGGIGSELRDNEDYPNRLLEETYFRRSGQTTITISIFKDRQGRWRVSRYYPYNGSNLIIPKGDFSWLTESPNRINSGNGGEPVHGPVRVYSPAERIPILVLRNETGQGTSQDGQDPGSVMVWLERGLLKNFRLRKQDASRRETTSP